MLPRSGRVDGGVDHARAALALGEPRAAPVRSGWAEATQRGRGNGGKVVRKRGRGMKICRVKYYVDFRWIFYSKNVSTRWNHGWATLEIKSDMGQQTNKQRILVKIFPYLRIPWHSVPVHSNAYRIMCPK